MKDYEKIINDLKTINSMAKYEVIKIVMARRILDKYKDNEEFMSKILDDIKDTEIYNLVLKANC
jgi:uncharacterized hydantoinase/oxoprolinase family protein